MEFSVAIIASDLLAYTQCADYLCSTGSTDSEGRVGVGFEPTALDMLLDKVKYHPSRRW